MSGRNKNQRVKNNARPSNSGRSAEFLEDSLQHFGFQTFKEKGVINTTFSIQKNDIFASNIDQEVQLLFKKMLKKDSTTKFRALQEFSEAVKRMEVEDVKLILPYWSKIYYSLSTDLDNKVREACQLSHYEVILKVKRDLAPFLKQIIAPWFTSLYDTYPPAATAATQAFNATFPEKKMEDVMAFCSEEILLYIDNNLLTPNLNDQKLSEEDKESKSERVIVTSLLGFSLFMKKISAKKIENSDALIKKIIGHKQFWAYSKHKMVRVKASWYETLIVLIQKVPSYFEDHKKPLLFATIGRLDEADPVVLPWVWQNILLTVSTVENWWTYLKFEDIKKKLWNFLREAGKGNAATLFPNLLPFISHLSFIEDKDSFYSNFFSNLCLGLTKITSNSKSEVKAIATSLIECLKFVILQMKEDVEFCEKLIRINLFAFLEWNFTQPQFTSKLVFTQIASLVQYWSRNQAQEKNYQNYVTCFWAKLSLLFEELYQTKLTKGDETDVVLVAEKQTEFLIILKNISVPKEKGKVMFSDLKEADSNIDSRKKGLSIASSLSSEYNLALKDLVVNTIISFWNIVEQRKFKEIMKDILVLLKEEANIWSLISQKSEFNLEIILSKIFTEWLLCEDLKSKALVDVIFVIYDQLNEEDQKLVIRYFKENNDILCFIWILKNALIKPYNENLLIKTWLTDKQVMEFLVNLIVNENVESSEIISVIQLAVSESQNGDIFIGDAGLNNIISSVHKILLNQENNLNLVERTAIIATNLCNVVYTSKNILKFGEDLIISLVKLSWGTISSKFLSESTLLNINQTLFNSLKVLFPILSSKEIDMLLNSIINLIQKELNVSRNENTLLKINGTLTNIARSSDDMKISENIISRLFSHPFCKEWRNEITYICLNNNHLLGKITCTNNNQKESLFYLDDENIVKYFTWAYFKINVLFGDLEFEENEESKSENENSIVNNLCDEKKSEWLSSILYDIVLFKSFLEDFQSYKYFKEVQDYFKNFDNVLIKLKESLNDNVLNNMLKLFTKKCSEESDFWLNAAFYLYVSIIEEFPIETFKKLILTVPENSKLYLIQMFGKYLTLDDLPDEINDIESVIIARALNYCSKIDGHILKTMKILYDVKKNFAIIPEEQKIKYLQECLLCCNSLILNKYSILTREDCDLVLLYLSDTLTDFAEKPVDKELYPIYISSLTLYSSIVKRVKEFKSNQEEIAFTSTWDDLFAESLLNYVTIFWYNATELYETDRVDFDQSSLLISLETIAEYIDVGFMSKNSDKSERWNLLLNRSFTLLQKKTTCFQLLGYKMLQNLIPLLLEIDLRVVSADVLHEEGLVFNQMIESLESTESIVNAMLAELRLGEDTCTVEPFTDSFSFAFAYLLIWDLILDMCAKASNELKYQYADILKEKELLNKLCNNIFRLMPTELLHFSKGKRIMYFDYFRNRPIFKLNSPCSSVLIEHQSCWIYATALYQLPAMVRQWWSNIESKVAHIVENLTILNISPHLCKDELDEISAHEKVFKNMTIKVMPGVRDILAVYTVDDAKMELVITLPKNYPLTGPDVQCNSQIEHTSQKSWLLQFKKCVLHQNGKIWDGIFLWNKNLDKKFDGVEECYICFGVLHTGTYQLPKLCCHTCKKKFHSACLYKWFSTSNKSSCPICRNLF